MIQRMNPPKTGFSLAVLMLLALLTPVAALAGNTHSEGGAVVESPGVPETDGIAPVMIYWTGDSSDRAATTVGTALAGYWLQDVGFALQREWQVGDDQVAVLEFETSAGTTAHAGYYGVINNTLTSLDPDEFPAMTVRAIPVPAATAGGGYVDLAWSPAAEDPGAPAMTNVAGYNVLRSTDGVAFTRLNTATLVETTYRDDAVTFGDSYYYALGLVYRGAPEYVGTAMSANSDMVTPLDTTPPNAPTLAAEPPFTSGLGNTVAWSSESASGAAAYYAEAALDDAFTNVVANSGWKPDTTHTFTLLQDGITYFYRVHARDTNLNESDFSAHVSSRQDATPPQSNLLALTGYKSSSTVELEWAASDSVSGVGEVQLYYAKDGGAYALYAGGPFTASPISFDASTVGGDGTYDFYTVATDAVGNAEEAPETPDASTTIDTQPPDSPVLAALEAFTQGTSRTLTWSDTSASGAVGYRVEASTTPTFDTITDESAWIPEITWTFTGLSDGVTYHYRVRSRDAAGNESGFSDLTSSTQDATAPETSVEPLPAATASQQIAIDWTGGDTTSGLASVQLRYSKDGGAWMSYAGGPFTTSPIAFDASTVGGDGDYAFLTLGTDAVGNVEAAPVAPDAQTTIDTAPPTAPVIAALPVFTAGSSITLTFSASDAAEYMAEAATDVGFTAIVAQSNWITEASYEFTGLSDGQQYFYRARVRDAAGNESAPSEAATSTQDASTPETSVAALPALVNTPTVDIAWSGSDTTSGLANVDLHYSKDGGPFVPYPGGPFASSPISFDASTTGGDGDYALYTRGRDAAGNLEGAPATPDAHITFDTSAPGAPSIAGMQPFTSGGSVNLVWTDESSSGAEEYLAEMSTTSDFAGVDATSGWISDLAWEFTGLADAQSYHFRVQARDGAQNETGFSGLQSTTMDATAPESSVETLPAVSSSAQFDIAWTGADATSGVANVDLYYSRDGEPFTLYPDGPFESSPIGFDASQTGGDGDYALYTRAHDLAGNAEDAPGAADAMITVDTQAPAEPVIAALPQFSAGSSLEISWSDRSASGAAEYLAQASTDPSFSTLVAASGWITATSHTFASLADDQTYHYRVKARDAARNETSFSALEQSTMDASAPQSNVEALPGYMGSTTIDIAWSGSDATSGVAHVDLYYSKDGAPFAMYPGGPFESSPIAFDAGLTGGEGAYSFYTRAHDVVGNEEEAPAAGDAGTTIDVSIPDVPVIAEMPSFLPGTSSTITWSHASGATEYRAQISTDPSFSSLVDDSGWIAEIQHTFSGLTDGQIYLYRVQARDAALEETPFSDVFAATQDATPPTSQVGTMPSVTSRMPVAIEWSGFDITSGIAGADLYYSRDGSPFELYEGSPFSSNPIAFDPSLTGGDGQYAFFTRVHDGAGNVEGPPAAPDAQTRIDTAAPDVPVITSLPEFSPGSTIVLSWSDQSTSGAIEYMAEMSTDPEFATLAGASNWIPSTSFVFNGLDDGSGYHFRAKARDAALNETEYTAVELTTMDDTAPASQVSEMPAVVTSETFGVEWTGSDATSGIASVELYYALDGGAYTAYPGGPFTESPIPFDIAQAGGEGEYAFYTRARDAVGNRETAPGGPDAQTLVSTARVGVPTLVELPAFSAGTSRTVSWDSADGAIEYLVQAAEDEEFASIFSAKGWVGATAYTFDGLEDGDTYWFRVRGRNEIGVEGDFSPVRSTTQDATPPISQVAPLSNKIASQTIDIVWAATDATSGVAGVELMVSRDGGDFNPYPGGPFTQSPIAFDASVVGGDGEYAFYTLATDNVGNVEAAPEVPDARTTIDTQAPDAPVMVAEPEFTSGNSNTVSWQPVAGARDYMAQCASDAMFLNVIETSGWITETSNTFTGLESGTTYYFRVRARDAALNMSFYSAAVWSIQSPGRILDPGWNLVSFDVAPDDPSIDDVLTPLAGSFNIVRSYQDGQFLTYLPALPVEMNDLQTMDPRHGYWIYMTRRDTLVVSGAPVPDSTPISLDVGWELVGYLPDQPLDPSLALFSIDASLVLARGYDSQSGYSTYYPSLGSLSDLDEMRPGHGYWMYMSEADQLIYSSPGLPLSLQERPRGERKQPPALAKGMTGSLVPTVMDVWSTNVTIDGEPAPVGTILEAYDASGELAASHTLKQTGLLGVMHIDGDVSITAEDEGVIEGELLTFKVRDLDVTLRLEEPITWSPDAVLELDLEFVNTASLLPRAYSLQQNYPNPFNPATMISYAIPRDVEGEAITSTHVRLRVFDIRGRVVRTLVDSRQAPGRYEARWDGRDDGGRSVGTGVYFYRLKTDQFTKTRKMMMVK